MMKKRYLVPAILAGTLALTALPAAGLVSAAGEPATGDVNGDGTLSVADAVLLQRWLLSVPETVLADWQAGDLCSDGSLDVFDLALLKQKLVSEPAASETNASEETTAGYVIVFSGDSVSVTDANGNAAAQETVTVSGQIVTITQPGEYTVSGNSDNGQIIVDVDKAAYPDGKVTLSCEGLTLTNPSAAPLYVASIGDECVLSVKKGTVNTFADGTAHADTYTNSDGETKEITSAIFARDDLKIKGKGTLIVNGNTADGIVCTEDLKLYNGTIEVHAADGGIRGKDSVRIGDADAADFNDLHITVNTENGDGIQSGNTSDESKGFVEINGGTVSIESHADGIQAARNVRVNGGDITIKTYEGSEYAAAGTTDPQQPDDGSFTFPEMPTDADGNTTFPEMPTDADGNTTFPEMPTDADGNQTRPGGPGQGGTGFPGGGESGHDLGLDFSAKGIKAGDSDASIEGEITISGGTITIDSTDDSIHCGGMLTVDGGTIQIASADDALHCDKYLHVNGGTVRITKSYEGLEAMQIYVTDGDITVYAEDDPVNAGEKGVRNEVDVANDNCIVRIDGGVIHAYVTNTREGDGIDSNGSIVINGGEIYVEGSVDGPDSALDSDGEMLVNGGMVMAIGGLGRGELPENTSQQCSLYWGDSGTTYQSGSVIALLDADGNELLTYTSEQTFKCAVISSPQIQNGGSYSITVNGETVAQFTVSGALTTQGDIGSSGGGGGFGQR